MNMVNPISDHALRVILNKGSPLNSVVNIRDSDT